MGRDWPIGDDETARVAIERIYGGIGGATWTTRREDGELIVDVTIRVNLGNPPGAPSGASAALRRRLRIGTRGELLSVGPPWRRAVLEVADRVDGLSPAEGEVMDALVLAWNRWVAMGGRDHPRGAGFCDGIHRAQCALAAVAMRRMFPEGWR